MSEEHELLAKVKMVRNLLEEPISANDGILRFLTDIETRVKTLDQTLYEMCVYLIKKTNNEN